MKTSGIYPDPDLPADASEVIVELFKIFLYKFHYLLKVKG
jgi:hypothetical protein